MSAKAYLTIDDSPSTRMDDLIGFLSENNVPALFFCRGDKLEENPIMAVKAIERGFVLGNHGFSHRRASDISYDEMVEEIERTERILHQVYTMADAERPGMYFRFPHLDRGCGAQVVDYETFEGDNKKAVMSTFTEGLNTINLSPPSPDKIEKKEKLQAYLKERGFTSPFKDVTVPWYDHPEIEAAADCLFTFSTCDWMVSSRHRGKWRYQSVEDLKIKMDRDMYFSKADQTSIVLAHDQAEIVDVTIELVDWMLDNKVRFLDYS